MNSYPVYEQVVTLRVGAKEGRVSYKKVRTGLFYTLHEGALVFVNPYMREAPDGYTVRGFVILVKDTATDDAFVFYEQGTDSYARLLARLEIDSNWLPHAVHAQEIPPVEPEIVTETKYVYTPIQWNRAVLAVVALSSTCSVLLSILVGG